MTIHYNLIEALGWFFVFGAWGLDWWYVQSAHQSLVSFDAYIRLVPMI